MYIFRGGEKSELKVKSGELSAAAFRFVERKWRIENGELNSRYYNLLNKFAHENQSNFSEFFGFVCGIYLAVFPCSLHTF